VAYDFGRNASFNDHGEHWWQRWLADTKISFTIPNALNRGPSLLDKYSGRYGVYDPRLRRYVLNFAKKL
jgi:hypothetical protein